MTTKWATKDSTLTVDSPLARALFKIMSGQRIVRLDCGTFSQVTFAAAAIHRLILNRPSDSVTMITNSRQRAFHIANKFRASVSEYLPDDSVSVWDPINGIRMAGHGHGIVGPSRIDVESGAMTTKKPYLADLIVAGFDETPWRGLTSTQPWDSEAAANPGHPWETKQEPFAVRSRQILILGHEMPWHSGLALLMAPVQAQEDKLRVHRDWNDGLPWGDIPLDIMLAGGGE